MTRSGASSAVVARRLLPVTDGTCEIDDARRDIVDVDLDAESGGSLGVQDERAARASDETAFGSRSTRRSASIKASTRVETVAFVRPVRAAS